MKIGLALSGGGVRATVFHLGVLARLACDPVHRLESVKAISTVSGGSLAIGLVLAKSRNQWPASDDFCHATLPSIADSLTSSKLQSSYFWRVIFWIPGWFGGRAHVMGKLIRDQWGVDLSLKDLPDDPYWFINASTFETGKNWRFEKERMGDYLAGYVLDPDFPISDALGASAAFPRIIGPLRLRTKRFSWHKRNYGHGPKYTKLEKNPFRKFRLWDGGVYENLGTEALFKPIPLSVSDDPQYKRDLDFLVVSDASAPLGIQRTNFQFKFPFYAPAVRLVYISTDQVRALRARMFLNYLGDRPGTGVFIKIGNSTGYISREAEKRGLPKLPDSLLDTNLKPEDTEVARDVGTTLKRLPRSIYSLLFRHGFEAANATLAAYCPSSFGWIDLPEGLGKLFEDRGSGCSKE